MSHDGAGHGGGHDGGHGFDIGHAGGLGSADLDMGHSHGGHHHGGKGHNHHHGSHDHGGKVTVEALMVAHAHAAVPGFDNFGHVNASVETHGTPDHGHVSGTYSGDGIDSKSFARGNEGFLHRVELAKHDPMRRTYGVHVVSHGFCELTRIFTELGTKLGAIRVCGTTGNFYGTDISLNDLTDWSKFSPPYSRRRAPAGWYANAMGVTHVWRQYWQVPTKNWLIIKPKGRKVYERNQHTYIEVQIVTWFYSSIGDYETRVDINVVSLPVLDQRDKRWGVLATPLKRHQELAEGLQKGLFDALKFALPTPWARDRRAKLIALQTTRPAEVEKSGADLDTLFITKPEGADERLSTVTAVNTQPSTAADATPPAEPVTHQPPVLTGKEVTVHVTIPPVAHR